MREHARLRLREEPLGDSVLHQAREDVWVYVTPLGEISHWHLVSWVEMLCDLESMHGVQADHVKLQCGVSVRI